MAPPSCFAALPLPPVPAIAELHSSLPPELRPIHPEDLHLTVAYFGRVDPALHPSLLEAIGALPFAGADVVLSELLVLPNRQRASAVTLELGPGPGRDAVVSLMATHRDPLRALAGLPGEGRPPLPHVTFARPRGKPSPGKRDATLAWADAQPALGVPVMLGRPVLMRSRPPGGPGPHYEKVLR